MKRRDFLKLSGAGLTFSGLTACNDSSTSGGTTPPAGPPYDLLDFQPTEAKSENGVLTYEMSVQYGDPIVDGITLDYRTFNGKFPPDTLVARAGDKLKIHFINNLPSSEEDHYHPHNINIPHGFNNTNLHTHGLNVSPEGNEDNVLLVLRPGDTFDYEINLPEDHPSGLYWYHPHKHGSALHQLGSGMCGFLRIEGGEDDLRQIPEIAAAQAVDLEFHELIFDIQGRTPAEGLGEAAAGNPDPDPEARNPIISLLKREAFLRYTINGLAVDEGFFATEGAGPFTPPTLRMRPGELQHWRFGLLCHLQTYNFVLEGHKLRVAAWDGITADQIEVYNNLVLGPANRVDLLIKASNTPGTYAFKMVFEQFGEQTIGPYPILFSPGAAYPSGELTVFNLIVEGDPMPMRLPAALNPPSARLPYILDHEITRHRQIDFKVTGEIQIDPTTFAFIEDTRKYYINNLQFSGNRINETMLLGTAEEWTITNNHLGQHQFPQINHPFHIHVNWFQVMSIHHADGHVEYPNNGLGRWMDSVDVPFGGKTVIRHRFEHFPGIFPFHCHVIAHEDEGMMQLVEVVDPAPVTVNITAGKAAVLESTDLSKRVHVRFRPNNFATDSTATYYFQLDPGHAVDEGMIGLERYFGLQSKGDFSGTAVVTVRIPLELAHGETYDPATVRLYRSDGTGWTKADVQHISLTDGVLVSHVSTLGHGYFAVLADMLSGPVTDPSTDDGSGHGHDM